MSTLCVFYVNRGYLVVVDYPVTLQTVRQLQSFIREATGISTGDQVLLTPNGSTMEPEKRVNAYPDIGTPHKPVFLFARSFKSEREELTVSQQREEVVREIVSSIEQGDSLMRMPDRVAQYHKLFEHATSCVKMAETTVQTSARIVQEHHNLNGGWNALVSNLNDTQLRLERKQKKFLAHVEKMEQLKEKSNELLEGFGEAVEQLKTIKLPPSMHTDEKIVSLFDWIAATDPSHTLAEVAAQVAEQIKAAPTSEVDAIKAALKTAHDLLSKSDNREIKGLNKRIAQIEHSLEAVNDFKESIVNQVGLLKHHNPRGMEDHVLNETIISLHSAISAIHELLKRMKDSCTMFFKSKEELLDNVRSRLFGWVVQAYDRLHNVHIAILLFEEKFTGLKQRLDLVRQVKEAPLMFATCITEIVRRNQLQKEFRAWHASHSERCHTFSGEENQLRTVFAAKLEKHFLRVIFQGMFDKLPVFFVKHVPEFDNQLPAIDLDYYKELRKSVGAFESVLRINTPQVHQRLSGRPSSLVSAASTTHLRREESFISYDQSSNLTTDLQKAFPSSAWLVDDGMDMSPSVEPAMLMSPGEKGSFNAERRLPSLHDIHEHGTAEADHHLVPHSLKSAPISIPIRGDHRGKDDGDTRFSTPEDQFIQSKEDKEQNMQFLVDDISTRSQMMEVLGPMITELKSLNQDLADTKADLSVYRDRLIIDAQDAVAKTVKRFAEVLYDKDTEHKEEKDQLLEKIRRLEEELAASQKATTAANEEKEKLRTDLNKVIEEKDENIKSLNVELEAGDQRLKEATDEIFKKLTIEYELIKDQEASDYRQIIEDKEEEIRHLHRELEKKQHEIEKLKNGPGSEEFRKIIETDTRTSLEKEFKTRVELLSKGFEHKKEEAVARMKKEVEFDWKKKEAENEHATRLLLLERDLLRSALDDPNAAYKTAHEVAEHVEAQSDKIMQESSLSHYMITSPRSSPRKQSSMDHLSVSITSLNSPIPDSPPEEHPVKVEEMPLSVQTPEETVVPKIIAPGDITPKKNDENLKSELETKEEKESGENSSKEDSDSSCKREEGMEKRAEKRRSTERVENEGKKTLLLMEESFCPGMMPDTQTPESPSEEMPMDEMTTSTSSTIDDGSGHISLTTQTKITLKTMEYMVSLYDVREGATVLVVWDDRHNAYIIFCISNCIHFIKETSVKRLGLNTTEETTCRKNWVLGRVQHIDLCKIKKAANRYKLPVDTQVYRVDVLPVALDPNFAQATMPLFQP